MRKKQLWKRITAGVLSALIVFSQVSSVVIAEDAGQEATVTESVTEALTEAATEPQTAAPTEQTEAQTQAPTQEQTQAPTQEQTESQIQEQTQAETQFPAETQASIQTNTESTVSTLTEETEQTYEIMTFGSNTATEATEGETEAGLNLLEDENGDIKIMLITPDNTYFPSGTKLVFRANEELSKLLDEDATYQEFADSYKEDWKEELSAKYVKLHPDEDWTEEGIAALKESVTESVEYIIPFYFDLVDETGNTVAFPEGTNVYLYLRDEDMVKDAEKDAKEEYASNLYNASSMEKDKVDPIEDMEVVLNKEGKWLFVTIPIEETGLYTFIQMDANWTFGSEKEPAVTAEAAAEEVFEEISEVTTEGMTEETSEITSENTSEIESELEFQKTFSQECECGAGDVPLQEHEFDCNAVKSAFASLCTCGAGGVPAMGHMEECEVLASLHAALCTCGGTAEDFDSHTDDCPYMTYLMNCAEYMNSQVSMAYVPSGTQLKSASGWTKITTTTKLAAGYATLKWYSKKSSVTKVGGTDSNWYNTASNLICPKNDSASCDGKQGWIWNNVIMDHYGTWLSLKCVVAGYTKTASFNGTTEDWLPAIAYGGNGLYILFYYGRMCFKCTVINADTGAAGGYNNFRITCWDVDGNQEVAFKYASGESGKMSAKHYYSEGGSHLYYKSNVTYAGVSGTDFVVASEDATTAYKGSGTVTDDMRKGFVGFEFTNCKEFYLGCGMWRTGLAYSNSKVTEIQKATKKGTLDLSSANIQLYSAYYDSPSMFSDPYMQVYPWNNGKWGIANTLSSATGIYKYRVLLYVANETPTNYYNTFKITNTLPKGVDYVSDVKVVDAVGNDRTTWFTITTSNDVITATAKAANLNAEAFYGNSYFLEYTVRMDPTEITGTYDGDSITYKVNNSATVYRKHKTDSAQSTATTNTVTTTATEKRPTVGTPTKRFDANTSTTTKTLSALTDTITYSIYQTFPECISVLRPNKMVVTDTLPDCLEFVSYDCKYQASGATTWTDYKSKVSKTANGQTITLTTTSFTPSNQTYRFDITCKIKEGYSLDVYAYMQDEIRRYYRITNKAFTQLTYSYGTTKPAAVGTNNAELRVPAGVINVTKEFQREIPSDTDDLGISLPMEGPLVENETETIDLETAITKYGLSPIGATFTIQDKDGNIVDIVTIEDDGGTTRSSGMLPIGTYTVTETAAPDGTERNSASKTVKITPSSEDPLEFVEVHTTIANTMYGGYIKIQKGFAHPNGGIFTSLAAVKQSYGVVPTGATFAIWDDSGTVVETLTVSGEDGVVTSPFLSPGTYTVTETAAPTGTELNDTPVEVTISDTSKTDVKKVAIVNDLISAVSLTIIKGSQLLSREGSSEEILDLSGYSVMGAQYKLYSDEACTKEVPLFSDEAMTQPIEGMTIDTEEDSGLGTMSAPVWFEPDSTVPTYYVKEVTASPGHGLNTQSQELAVDAAVSQEYILAFTGNQYGNVPEFAQIPSKILEMLGDNGKKVPGVVFEVKFYDGDSRDTATEETLKKTWYLKSDEEGNVRFAPEYLADTMFDTYQSDAFYYYDDQIVIPRGFLTVQEVEAPVHYVTDDQIYEWNTSVQPLETIRHYNALQPCQITLDKLAADASTPLSGVTFRLALVEEETVEDPNLANADWEPPLREGDFLEATTDAKGRIIWKDLPQGTYQITEIKTTNGNALLTEAITVTLPMTMTLEEAKERGDVDLTQGVSNALYDDRYYFFHVKYQVSNHAVLHMPAAGGAGDWKLGYVGLALLAGIAFVTLPKKKQRVKT